MGKSKNLSEREKGKIDAYLSLKLTQTEIAQRIRRSRKCVQTYVKQMEQYGKNYRGSSKKMSKRETSMLIKTAQKSKLSCSELKRDLNLSVSRWTIARQLKRASMKWKKLIKQPFLTKKTCKIVENFVVKIWHETGVMCGLWTKKSFALGDQIIITTIGMIYERKEERYLVQILISLASLFGLAFLQREKQHWRFLTLKQTPLATKG